MSAVPDFPARPAWQQSAACRGLGPDLFFIDRGEPARDAQDVCAACTVRAECLEAGLHEKWGVWGETTELERRRIRRARNQERRAS